MDVAYDQIQKEALDPEEVKPRDDDKGERPDSGLNTELRDAYKTLSESSWGTTLGGLWGTVKKQGETYYEGARQELSAASTEASKGLTDLISNTNTLSLGQKDSATPANGTEEMSASTDTAKGPESLSKDIVKEAESILATFRVGAAARLKQVQKAEDAADEALLKFGTNIGNFLRDAITITGPEFEADGSVKGALFESKDSEGRRVVHATRFDAQLHVIHSTLTSFTEDPKSDEYAQWKADFDAEKKTGAISQDLSKYEELRRSMEKLVPEQVEYKNFWMRYYFLRHVVEEQEQKRRELLSNTQADDEDVKWDDDDEEDDKAPATPKGDGRKSDGSRVSSKQRSEKDSDLLKPEGRRSNEHSVADSEASYDIVSSTTSRGPGSPREEKEKKKGGKHAEESEEEDWE